MDDSDSPVDESSPLELLVPRLARAVRGRGASGSERGAALLCCGASGRPVQIIEGKKVISGRLVRVACSVLHLGYA
jgi:hypothetical protein